MAKTKADYLAEAKKLGLEVNDKMKVAEIQAAIKLNAESEKPKVEEVKNDKQELKVAKAGKRSEKGLKEAEEKQAKIERQKEGDEEEAEAAKPKAPVKQARPKIERRGKKYREVVKLIEKDKEYALKPAIELLPKISTAKFDATTELHVRINVDPKQADQNIRGTMVLPAGTGKDVRVAVFGDDDDVATAKKAGADVAGNDAFLAQLDKGEINFDVLIASPKVMAKLGKYARVLGPKGLMPNPKSGTVTTDIEKAVKEAKAGRVEYRVDEAGIVHIAFGKVSFGADKLVQNAKALLKNLKASKPASVKGTFINSAYVTVSMGPSVKLDVAEINSL